MGLISRFFQDQPDSGVLHSSGIAAANDGSQRALNAMRHETFEQRAARERNRQHIGNYRSSTLALHETVVPSRPTTDASEQEPAKSTTSSSRLTRQQVNAQIISQPSVHKANFSPPKSRGYNPYS